MISTLVTSLQLARARGQIAAPRPISRASRGARANTRASIFGVHQLAIAQRNLEAGEGERTICRRNESSRLTASSRSSTAWSSTSRADLLLDHVEACLLEIHAYL